MTHCWSFLILASLSANTTKVGAENSLKYILLVKINGNRNLPVSIYAASLRRIVATTFHGAQLAFMLCLNVEVPQLCRKIMSNLE